MLTFSFSVMQNFRIDVNLLLWPQRVSTAQASMTSNLCKQEKSKANLKEKLINRFLL